MIEIAKKLRDGTPLDGDERTYAARELERVAGLLPPAAQRGRKAPPRWKDVTVHFQVEVLSTHLKLAKSRLPGKAFATAAKQLKALYPDQFRRLTPASVEQAYLREKKRLANSADLSG